MDSETILLTKCELRLLKNTADVKYQCTPSADGFLRYHLSSMSRIADETANNIENLSISEYGKVISQLLVLLTHIIAHIPVVDNEYIKCLQFIERELRKYICHYVQRRGH